MIRLPPKKKPAETASPEVQAEVVENTLDTPAAAPEPAEEPLVEGALTAKTEKVRTAVDILKGWRDFVGPNAKPIACAFCGQFYYLPCKSGEHSGCMNFHAAEKKRAKIKEPAA